MADQNSQDNSSNSNNSHVEVLRAVFPLLDGKDLALCMCVCKLWQDVSKEDYLWKLVCARNWPSTVRSSPPPSLSPLPSSPGSRPIGSSRGYFHFFSSLRKRRLRPSPCPELRFEILEFYLDIWNDSVPTYSDVIPGPVAISGIRNPPANICRSLRDHLLNSSSQIHISVNPHFAVSFARDITVSLIVRRKDRDQVVCLIDKTTFDYVDAESHKAHTYDYLQMSAKHPFVSNVRAWLALLLVDSPNNGQLEVFGLELDFGDVADSYMQILLLMDMLDWK